MWQRLGVLRVKCQKASLTRQPGACTCVRGSVLNHTSHVIWKLTVNISYITLTWVIRPIWHSATNFIFYSKFAVHNILQHYFGTREDDE
jgi:hypothetical protein